RGFQASRPASVDEFQFGHRTDGRHDSGSTAGELGRRTPLHPTHRGPRDAGVTVGHSGDLPFVTHHPDESEPPTTFDRRGQLHRLSGSEHRGTTSTDVDTGDRPPRGVELQTDPNPWMGGTECRVDEIE